jgi:hypothetical protein
MKKQPIQTVCRKSTRQAFILLSALLLTSLISLTLLLLVSTTQVQKMMTTAFIGEIKQSKTYWHEMNKLTLQDCEQTVAWVPDTLAFDCKTGLQFCKAKKLEQDYGATVHVVERKK